MITTMPMNPPERLSKFLPTVKCSTCLQPVALTKLGDHTCLPPPPIPSAQHSGVPPVSSTTTERDRLPPRVASPAISIRSTASSKQIHPASSPRIHDSSNRLRIDTVARVPPSPTFKSSPLAHPADRQATSSPKPGPSIRDTHPNLLSSPLRTRADSSLINNQSNTTNGGSAQSTPSTARPPLSFDREYTSAKEPGPSRDRGPPQSGFPPGPRLGQTTPLPPPRIPAQIPQSMTTNAPSSQTNDVPFPSQSSVPGLHNNPPPPPAGYPRRPGLPGSMVSVSAPPPPWMSTTGGGPHQGSAPSPRVVTTSLPPVRPNDVDKSGQAFIPPMERGIDTSSGGEAGMAGVGRRGFAAAARAAMFVAQASRPMGPQPQPHYNRKQMVPQHLDLNAAARPTTETPPLSAGSGYSSSQSPGPMSPQLYSQQQLQLQPPSRIHRTPSPAQQPLVPVKPNVLALPPPGVQTNGIANDYISGNMSAPVSPHLLFFEKYNNSKPPGMGPQDWKILPNDTKAPLPTVNMINHSIRTPVSQTPSTSSASVGASSASKGKSIPDPPSSAESEYSGLAYADSTDYEDNEDAQRGRSLTSPRGAPLKASILRSISSNTKVQFGSVSERSRSNDSVSKVRRNAARSTLRSETNSESYSNIHAPIHSANHSRDNSVSSYSSNAESVGGGRARSNSSAIAHALGLSQTPPSGYGRLGGPGVYNVEGRLARSASGKSVSGGNHSDEKEREKQGTSTFGGNITEVPKTTAKQVSSSVASSSSGLSIALRERARDESEEGLKLNINLGPKAKAQRSNTVQVQSPDVKSVKLPMRSQSEREKPAVGEVKSNGKEKAKKSKVCLKCATAIQNGRWVSTDGGGVLCEKCWKNMYLPKCRRCNLPIERQAVSSSDGQLKGKYHKQCFNCHECHKAFPDKTFYVYDGKPLCAYHYHEANDSLCAAARCGQPIEGPCAVSHTGDRYHPEHMTCEYPGSDCGEKLDEYWEVEQRMLCERHAVHASRAGSDEERWGSGKKGLKRVTRFIDLAGGGINPPANNGEDGHGVDGNSGLR